MQNSNYYPALNSYLMTNQNTCSPTPSSVQYNTSYYYGGYNPYNDSYNISPATSSSSSSSSSPSSPPPTTSSYSSNDHNSTYSIYNTRSYATTNTTNTTTTTTAANVYPLSGNYNAYNNAYYPLAYSYYNQTTPYQSSTPNVCTLQSLETRLDTPPMNNNNNSSSSMASPFHSSWNENVLNTRQQKQQQQTARNIINDLEIDDDIEEENEMKSGFNGVSDDFDKQKANKRRTRTQFSLEQRRYLLSVFQRTSYPCKDEYEEVARSMGVSVSVLQTWFKNTRSKQKKLTHRKNL